MTSPDLRQYARQTGIRLVIGALLLIFIVGDGLIFIIYGPASALMGLLCLAGALIPVLLIWLILLAIEWMVKRANQT